MDRQATHNSTPRINKFPIELLSEIFLYCQAMFPEFLLPGPSEPPLLFCQVCRVWRKVATLTPLLWSTITLHRSFHSWTPQLLNLWLSRADSCHLSVSFSLGEPPHTSHRQMHNSFQHFETLLPLSRRWKSLQLTNLSRGSISTLEDLPANPFPNLRRLVLKFADDAVTVPLGSYFHSALRLTDVVITGPRSKSLAIDLPWSQLTSLETTTLSWQACAQLLNKLPRLRRGTFEIARTSHQELETLPKEISLLHLESLNMETTEQLSGLFYILRLPALRALRIRFVNSAVHSPAADPTLLSSIAPFCSQLHSLLLLAPPVSEGNVIDFLRGLPSIINLELEEHSNNKFIGDQLLLALTHSGYDGNGIPTCLCPKLETLGLCLAFDFSEKLLIDIDESRCSGHEPLAQSLGNSSTGNTSIPVVSPMQLENLPSSNSPSTQAETSSAFKTLSRLRYLRVSASPYRMGTIDKSIDAVNGTLERRRQARTESLLHGVQQPLQ